MAGTITRQQITGVLTRHRRKNTYRRGYSGTVESVGHRVQYWYDVTGIRLSVESQAYLEEEAYLRSRTMIIDNYKAGELHCVLGGEQEVYGWWSINKE